MTTDGPSATPDRDQTDESLRAERQKADEIGQSPISIEDIADAVIAKARERADRVLSEARRKSDERLPAGTKGAGPRGVLERERIAEDAALTRERSAADDILKAERAEHAAHLESERDQTDRHLSLERARSDSVVTTRDEFLGIVSHDLRNMLGAIVGFGSMIATAELADDHRQKVLGLAERIQRTATRMNRLVGDLVDVASIEAGCLAVAAEIGDPTAVVEEAVDTFRADAAARGVSLLMDIAAGALVAVFDPARLLQVLVNLITNAIKFTPRGGSVVVQVQAAGDDLRFAVRDTGIGIAENQLVTVFERYRQGDPKDRRGVGLGLHISRSIVLGHGGKIWVESLLGKGSTFYFTVPVATGGHRRTELMAR